MKLSKTHWIVHFSLVALSVCQVLRVYLLNRQYSQAAGSKVWLEVRAAMTDYPEKYNSALPDKTHDKPSPEIYYRRKMAVANWRLWPFLLPLLGGLPARHRVASVLIIC
jgi:hypothetical protein